MTQAPDSTSPDQRAPLTLAEGACLGLVATGHRHGWALVRDLARDGELGGVWTLSRPLTYRAIDRLVERGCLTRAGREPGVGPERTLLSITPEGTRALSEWLATPVTHLRDVRTEFLVKLSLARRLEVDRLAMIEAQERILQPIVEAVAASVAKDGDDLAQLWRVESSKSVAEFLRQARAQLER